MASVDIKQVKHFNTDALILFLSKHGISQSGLKSLRDNQVEGEMLLEFTDPDLKDIFDVFKDRFLIRKLLRELHGLNNSSYRLAKPIASPAVSSPVISPPISVTPLIASTKITLPTSTFKVPLPAPQIPSEPIVTQVSDILPSKSVEADNKVAPLVIISNQQQNKPPPNTSPIPQLPAIPPHLPIVSADRQAVKVVSSLHFNSLSTTVNSTNSNTAIYSSPKTSYTFTSAGGQKLEFPTQTIDDDDDDDVDYPENDVYIVDGWGACRIKEFTAEELLRRKVRRGRPTEAQRLGRSLLREAATTAKIWHRAPPLKMISPEKKDIFFRYICRAAPQLNQHKQFVWIRLGEALQNRRKYLSDKESGRRQMKRKSDPNTFMSSIPLLNMNPLSPISTMPSSLYLPTSSMKDEHSPIVIDSGADTNIDTTSNEQTLNSVNLTTLIKEEAESEGIKYWTPT
ncbi:uncharacterized protein LOC115212324 [Argonauta hians]